MEQVVRDALLAAQEALAVWCARYAPEECSEENHAKAAGAIRAAGGTLAYIASVNAQIRDALATET